MADRLNYRILSQEQVKMLQQQGCTAESWQKVFVTDGFDVSRIRNVQFSGRVEIGATAGSIKDTSDIEKPCGIYEAAVINCTIGDNCRIARVGVHIANYDITGGVCIENIGVMQTNPNAEFGNGIEVNVLNEAGGREVTLFDELSAQFAYIMCLHRYRPKLIEQLRLIAKKYVESVKSSRGKVSQGVKISTTAEIVDVKIGPYAKIIGAAKLINGTILSSKDAIANVGSQVIAEDFIIAEGASVSNGAILEKVYIGQGCRIARQFSAENSLFFANSEGMHGEACSVFAGPYTVSHHKSSLLIAGLFSFYNAGSGTNQSNHMYKLGPVHEGKVERGCKTGSFSYMMWPCRVGPFSVVLGKHTGTFDTSDFPFSHLAADSDGRCMMVPGLHLTTVGTVRDGAKWPARDRRKGSVKRDIISFDVFSPYTVGKMIKAGEKLSQLQETTEKTVEEVSVGGAIIKRLILRTGQKYYRSGIEMYLLEKVVAKIEEAVENKVENISDIFTDESSAVYSDEWVDIGGQIMAAARLNELESAVEKGDIKTVADFAARTMEIQKAYQKDEWVWIKQAYWRIFNVDLNRATKAYITEVADNLLKVKSRFLNLVLADSQKEFGQMSRCGFGVDGDVSAGEKDFHQVRGSYETNKFVKQMNEEIKLLTERVNKLQQRIADIV